MKNVPALKRLLKAAGWLGKAAELAGPEAKLLAHLDAAIARKVAKEGLKAEELAKLAKLDKPAAEKLLRQLSAKEVLELERKLGKAKLETLAKTKTAAELKSLAKAPKVTKPAKKPAATKKPAAAAKTKPAFPANEFPAHDHGWQKWPPPPPKGKKPAFNEPGGARYRYDRYRYEKWKENPTSTKPPPGLKQPKQYFNDHVAPKAVGQSPGEPGSPAHKALVTKVIEDNELGVPKTLGTRRPDAVGKVNQPLHVGNRTIKPEPGGNVIYEAENFFKDGSEIVSEGRKQIGELRASNPKSTIVVQDVANPNNIVVFKPGEMPKPGGRLPRETPKGK